MPPESLANPLRLPESFEPAPDVWAWMRESFLKSASPLFNAEHGHLRAATIGVLWTNVSNVRQMRAIAGTAEVPQPKGSKWQIARSEHQLREWFGTDAIDFLITLDAPYCATAGDAAFCALVEHELYHCAQARNAYGAPRFTREGRPVFAIRGHDVEEFVGVVRRYGTGATSHAVQELVAAALRPPEIEPAIVAVACGTCGSVLS